MESLVTTEFMLPQAMQIEELCFSNKMLY